MLSPLQRQILGVVGELPEAARFALAGGAALILRGTVERGTNDLVLFIGARDMAPGAIHRVVEATETALAPSWPPTPRRDVGDLRAPDRG